MNRVSTYFALMAEFGTAEIKLDDCCDKYFGLNIEQAGTRARQKKLAVPTYRCGSQKSKWLVNAQDLADFIDARRQKAHRDWEVING